MNIVEKHNIIQAAIKVRFDQRMKEQLTDLALAVHYGFGSSTAGIHSILTGPSGQPWKHYDTIRRMLDDSPEYFTNVGLASAQGNYWRLTEEGQKLLEASFEHQLLDAQ